MSSVASVPAESSHLRSPEPWLSLFSLDLMRSLLVLFLTLAVVGCASARQSAADTAEATKLMHRAWELTHARHILYCYVPPRGNFAKNTGEMAKMIGYTAKERQPLVIYSPDSELATRMITIAFATIRPGALHDCTVVAAVGKKNDGYIRPVIEATGAKLYVEPLP